MLKNFLEDKIKENMDINDVKKALYRKKPIAVFTMIREKVVFYTTRLEEEEEQVIFKIPVEDMGSTSFGYEIKAHLLIRWIFDWRNTKEVNEEGK